MKIKIFSCGFCGDKNKITAFTRKGFRKHLREEHIKNNLFNITSKGPSRHAKHIKQGWVYSREV